MVRTTGPRISTDPLPTIVIGVILSSMCALPSGVVPDGSAVACRRADAYRTKAVAVSDVTPSSDRVKSASASPSISAVHVTPVAVAS